MGSIDRGLGQWNAYVLAGRDRQARRDRLAQVPERFRAQVESHVRTYFAIQAAQKPRAPR